MSDSYTLFSTPGTNKAFLNLYCNSVNASSLNVENNIDAQNVDSITSQTQNLLLDQNVVVSVPMVGYSLIYADNTDRLNVASQSQPTQQIAYLSDIPPPFQDNNIISNDSTSEARCTDGSLFNVFIDSNNRLNIDSNSLSVKDSLGNDRIVVTDPGYVSIRTNSVDTRIDLDSNGSIYWASNGAVVLYVLGNSTRIWNPDNSTLFTLDGQGVKINNNYYLPNNDGTNAQVMTTNGTGQASWSNLPTPQIYGLYSATGAPVTVINSSAQNNIIPSGSGSLNIPANISPGSSYSLKAGGVFRDNANNTQFTFRLLNNLSTLFTSGLLTLNSVPALTPFNIDIQFTYTGGNQMIINFKFSYSTGSDARGFTSQQVNNSYNASIINTLGLTLQFAVANINNTLTCNYLTITKIF